MIKHSEPSEREARTTCERRGKKLVHDLEVRNTWRADFSVLPPEIHQKPPKLSVESYRKSISKWKFLKKVVFVVFHAQNVIATRNRCFWSLSTAFWFFDNYWQFFYFLILICPAPKIFWKSREFKDLQVVFRNFFFEIFFFWKSDFFEGFLGFFSF